MSKSKGKKKEKYQEIPLDQIIEPDGRLRMEINEDGIEELAKSIASLGLRQAIEVVPRDDKFEIVYGERRVLAHRALGKETIWAKIVDLSEDQIAMIRATENVARSNLSPIEEAAAFRDLKDRFMLNIDQIAKKVGRSYSNVKRRLELLKMSKGVQKAVHRGDINISVAMELWQCPDQGHQEYLLQLAVEHGVTREVVRQWVNDFKKEKRVIQANGGEGEGDHSPMKAKAIYHTCEVCDGAISQSEVVTLLLCKTCDKRMKDAVA